MLQLDGAGVPGPDSLAVVAEIGGDCHQADERRRGDRLRHGRGDREGVSLFVDFAKSLQKEVVMQFLPPLVPQILQYLQQKPDHYFLVRDIFCTFYEYTVKT